MFPQIVILGGFVLMVTIPEFVIITIIAVGAGWLLYELFPETKKQKAKRNQKAINDLRQLSEAQKNRAIETGRTLINLVKTPGYVYAFAQRKIFNRGRIIIPADNYDGNAMKIGYTTKPPDVRAIELEDEYEGRVFAPVVIAKVNWCCEVERRVHEKLKLSGKWLWREMFDVTPDEAAKAIREAVKELDGTKILSFETRDTRSERFTKGESCRDTPLGPDLVDKIPF